MRLIFAGTPSFAATALDAILSAGHDVRLVLTQQDKSAGRGLKTQPSAVKRLAETRGLALFQPPTLRDPQAIAKLAEVKSDIMIVAAYGLILPQAVLEAPSFGALNIHASLLPRWRGAAPIQRALLAGDPMTGISIMRVEAGLDTGPVLFQESIDITPDDDAGSLHDRLALLGAQMIVHSLDALAKGPVPAQPQPAAGVTYASKIERKDLTLDWTQPAAALERAVRAFRPAPGASTLLEGTAVKIWRAHVAEGEGMPGVVLRSGPEGVVVACGRQALAITELQRAGGKRMPSADFLRGQQVSPGRRFGS